MSLRKTLPGMCLALPLLGGCADIMGFQDGRPFPPEDASVPVDASAEADTTSNPTTLDAGADSEEGGQAEGGDGGCPSGFLRCGSLCVPPRANVGCGQSQCKCPVATTNVLTNAGFNSDLTAWNFFPISSATAAWATDDAVGCPSSGSIRIKTPVRTTGTDDLTQGGGCITLEPSARYSAGLRARRLGTATGGIQIEIQLIPGSSNCQSGISGSISPPETDIGGDWTSIATPTSTASANSALFAIYVRKTDSGPDPFDVEIDMAYVAPSPGVGWQ
jgi:hypothetical protein